MCLCKDNSISEKSSSYYYILWCSYQTCSTFGCWKLTCSLVLASLPKISLDVLLMGQLHSSFCSALFLSVLRQINCCYLLAMLSFVLNFLMLLVLTSTLLLLCISVACTEAYTYRWFQAPRRSCVSLQQFFLNFFLVKQ